MRCFCRAYLSPWWCRWSRVTAIPFNRISHSTRCIAPHEQRCSPRITSIKHSRAWPASILSSGPVVETVCSYIVCSRIPCIGRLQSAIGRVDRRYTIHRNTSQRHHPLAVSEFKQTSMIRYRANRGCAYLNYLRNVPPVWPSIVAQLSQADGMGVLCTIRKHGLVVIIWYSDEGKVW